MDTPPDPRPEPHLTEPNPSRDDSRLAGVTVHAWLAGLFTLTICAAALLGISVREPLYSCAVAAIAYYFGQKKSRG